MNPLATNAYKQIWNDDEPHWREINCLPFEKLPQHIQPYFCESGSTTQRVLHDKGYSFTVPYLLEYWTSLSGYERYYLGDNTFQIAWVREVFLYIDQHPFMFARSIFPLGCMQQKGTILMQLGDQSLGSLLFADPHLQRSAFQWAQLQANHRLYQVIQNNLPTFDQVLWARSSTLLWCGHHIMLTEVFL